MSLIINVLGFEPAKEGNSKVRTRFFLIITMVVFFVGFNSSSYAINLDGDLSDWGITPGSDWVPDVESDYWVEDFSNYNNSGYVSPGYGGQPYDFEGFYTRIEDDTLYIAMVSGMPYYGANPIYSANGNPDYSSFQLPGDLAIDSTGDGVFDVAIELTGYSKNNPNGNSQSEVRFDPSKKGNIYRMLGDEAWNKGLPLSDYTVTEIDYYENQLLEYLDQTVVYYLQSQDPTHWVVETAVSLELLGTPEDTLLTLHWTQTCGNDIGEVHTFYSSAVPPSANVPEPGTLMLILSSVLGLLVRFFKTSK